MKNFSSLLNNRLYRLLTSWPPSLAGDFVQHYLHLQKTTGYAKNCSGQKYLYPFWILLPDWLQRKYVKIPGKSDAAFFSDLLWAEYCLFLCIRIQDDLFDGQADEPALVFAANLFLLEAEKVLSRYFAADSAFWNIFRDVQKKTIYAILENAAMHHSRQKSPGQLLAGYAKLSTHFNLAPAAVCLRYQRMQDFPHLTKFSIALAVAGQIIDDLEDIQEDLRCGKYNYAAQQLLPVRGKKIKPVKNISAAIAKEMLLSPGIHALFDQVCRYLKRAEQAIKPLDIKEAEQLVKAYQNGMQQMQNRFLTSRADFIFKRKI